MLYLPVVRVRLLTGPGVAGLTDNLADMETSASEIPRLLAVPTTAVSLCVLVPNQSRNCAEFSANLPISFNCELIFMCACEASKLLWSEVK